MRYVPLLIVLALAAPLAPLSLAIDDPEETGATALAGGFLPVGKANVVAYPLSSLPAFTLPTTTLRVEFHLDPFWHGRAAANLASGFGCLHGVPGLGPEADCADGRLVPVGGGTSLYLVGIDAAIEPSRVWPDGRDVLAITFAHWTDEMTPAVVPAGFYDLDVGYVRGGDGHRELQPRAVVVKDSFDATPRIAVVGDPQVGDPRGGQDALEDSIAERDPEIFLHVAEKTMFAFPGSWPAFEDAIEEINAFQPDFVLVTGDVTFGQDAPGKYFAEYETAWSVLQRFQVPTLLSVGNHDGYVQSGVDGFTLWERYFGPTHYAVDYGPSVHLVAINTYDWSELDRMGITYGVSAWGGQIRAAQLAWLAGDLAAFRARSPAGLAFTFAHHSPAWVQDEWPGKRGPQDGVPVAEQVARGAVSYGTTDQGWSGEGRLPLRDLLRAQNVTVHFAGHTHQDRVARDDHGLGVAGTDQSDNVEDDEGLLTYRLRDGTKVVRSQAELAAIVHDWSAGPLYVDTTTAASDTSEYWGWRQVDLAPDGAGGFELSKFSCQTFPITQAWLDEHAREPARWNAEHAALGLYSCPTYPGGL